MEELTTAEQQAMAYAPKVSASLSFVTCTYALVVILKNPIKRQKIYHRLIVAMCISSLPSSVAYFCGTWAMPVGTPSVIGASGNINTCTAQGFTLQFFGFAVPFYYAALSLYSFLAVLNDFSMEKLVCFDRGIHGCVFAWPLASSVVALCKQLYNPGGSWCHVGSYPFECNKNGAECIRGPNNPVQWKWILYRIPLILAVLASTVIIILLWWTVRNKEIRGIELTGKQLFLDQHRQKKANIVAKQASLYLAAFYASYFFPIIAAIINSFTEHIYIPIQIISNAIIPLHGFIYVFVYFTLQSVSEKKSKVSNASHTHVSHASFKIDECEIKKIHNKKESIFHGMNEEEKWEIFGVYVGSDGDSSDGDEENDMLDL